jgi:hypothetical protein
MTDTKETAPAPTSGVGDFCQAVRGFNGTIKKLFTRAAGNHDDAVLMLSSFDAYEQQFTKLLAKVESSYQLANVSARGSVNELMDMQAVTVLMKNAETAAEKSIGSKIGAGFFKWIGKIITEIKKLIFFILDHIFPNLPKWVRELILLIDQIINSILEILAGILGFKRAAVADELSQGEVHFMNEMSALQRWQNSSTIGASENDD